ncbi:MAG: hypothetical protein WCS90_05675 [Bacilli bacterium]
MKLGFKFYRWRTWIMFAFVILCLIASPLLAIYVDPLYGLIVLVAMGVSVIVYRWFFDRNF